LANAYWNLFLYFSHTWGITFFPFHFFIGSLCCFML
jgi:hypothetical protein